ncbi:LacI family DNA-binding transcriptional regulator [Paenisporosarcina sp. TG20]|uniref:LacI family DNA-binding transcriptional regulator n=1 Tax=Paenisporosarcina sp. TG20 TaxID=1211706 RepID=UPI00037266C9
MATIRDVAKESNVSVATVSRFINNKGYVSEDARSGIGKAIKKLNYKPNAIARSLSKKQTNFIGLILPDITNPFFPDLGRLRELPIRSESSRKCLYRRYGKYVRRDGC